MATHKNHHTADDEGEVVVEHNDTAPAAADSTLAIHPTLIAKVKALWQQLLSRPKLSIPLAAVVLVGLLLLVPVSRYALAGLFLKQTLPVVVVDAGSNKPISSATIVLGGVKATTDSQGKANLRVPVGQAKLEVTKQYYKSLSQAVLVPIGRPDAAVTVKLEATGRQIPVSVVNKISGAGVSGATISAVGTQAKTDAKGQAILVVPGDKQEVAATITADGHNKLETTLKVTEEQVDANTVRLTPSGKLYFLSNASGTIDLVKADLDGANRQIVLAGTGKEDRYNTVLFASRDWQYIALLSKRDGGEYAKLFLIEAASDKLTTIDEGEATFSLHGWSGDRLIYRVDRATVREWEPKRQTIKSYHVPTKKITALADTAAEGSQYGYTSERFDYIFVVDQTVIYSRAWGGYSYLADAKKASLDSIKADGSQKKMLKSFPSAYLNIARAEFGQLYVGYYDTGAGKYNYEKYHDGSFTPTKLSDGDIYNANYPVYAVSPSGKQTLWSDFRDGKYVFFVGDSVGQNGKQIGSSEDFTVYGWFSDDYLLLTRKGSELRILPASGLAAGVEAAPKVSDYYKPNYGVGGYGYGYGG